MFDQTLSDLIVCLMISQKNYIKKLHKPGVVLDGAASGESLSSVQPPMVQLQEDAIYGAGESLSMVQPPGSRSLWYTLRGFALYGTASGELLSTVQPRGSRSNHWGAALDGADSEELLLTVQSPGSRSRRCSLRGVALYGAASGESL